VDGKQTTFDPGGIPVNLRIEVELSSVFQITNLPPKLFVDLEEGEATVKELLRRLSQQWGEKIRPLLFEEGGDAVLSGLMVMVNDRTFTGTALNQQVVELHDKDKVSLLYFVSGG
jgi:sulfur carrier protein ThiS